MISTPLGPPISEKRVRAMDLTYQDDCFCVRLEDGRVLHTPIAWFITLHEASDEQLRKGEIIDDGEGLAWEDLDEHISIQALLSPSPLYRRAERGPAMAESLRL